MFKNKLNAAYKKENNNDYLEDKNWFSIPSHT
jgi:hypothetical protein